MKTSLRESDSKGSQGGGWTLTSEFTDMVDGVKTKATKGWSGMVNVDLLTAMMGAVTKEAAVPLIKEGLGAAEFVDKVKELISTTKDVVNEKKDKKTITVQREGTKNENIRTSADETTPDTLYIKKKEK